MEKEFNGRTYKTKNFFKEILLYGALTVACLVYRVWLGAVIFFVLTGVNVYLQIKRGGSIDDSIIKQGYYQYRQNKREAKIAEAKRREEFAESIRELEEQFDDSEIDEELARLEENERTE